MARQMLMGAVMALTASGLLAPAFADVPLPRIAPRTDILLGSFQPPAAPLTTVEDALRREVRADVSMGVDEFYESRGYRPFWTEDAAADLAVALGNARQDGLNPADYAMPLRHGLGVVATARYDVALTETALRYASHVHSGRTNPRKVRRIIDVDPPVLDAQAFLKSLAEGDAASAFEGAHPPHEAYHALRKHLRRALGETVYIHPKVGRGQNLRLGSSGPRVATLRARLGVTVKRGDDPTVFDESLRDAVKDFQRANKLGADGIVGPRTVRALDGTGQIDPVPVLIANLERWRWMPRDLGERHVFVNIPAFEVRVSHEDEEVYRGRVVVGKRSNPTPIFSDVMEHAVVNPYWNVPYSIASKEMLGSLRSNPGGFTRRHNYEVVMNGRVVNASSVSWTPANLRRVRIRQRPGRGNALGRVKFLFPNKHAVYLHDTPSKHLFRRTKRAYSHGCIRVHQPFVFADALLQGEPELTGSSLKRMIGGGERWVNLKSDVKVHLAYFTAEPAADGALTLHGDVYGIDTSTLRALDVR